MVSLSQDCLLLQHKALSRALTFSMLLFEWQLWKTCSYLSRCSNRPGRGQANEDYMILEIYSKATYCKNCINTGLGILSPWRLTSSHIGLLCMACSIFNSANSWTLFMKRFRIAYIFLHLSKSHYLMKINSEYLGWNTRALSDRKTRWLCEGKIIFDITSETSNNTQYKRRNSSFSFPFKITNIRGSERALEASKEALNFGVPKLWQT